MLRALCAAVINAGVEPMLRLCKHEPPTEKEADRPQPHRLKII